MSWWEEALRGLFAVPTGGMSEVVGRDNQFGRTVTGGLEGAGGGFITGGPVGAGMGAATGAGLSGTGTTDPYKLKGGAINFGSGLGAGGIGHAGMSVFGGGSGMTPYMPTSTPNMGAAGSTLGAGGSSSPLSLGGYGSTSGMGLGQGAGSSAATPSMISKVLQMHRMAGGQQQPAQAPQQDVMTRLYQMFPSLRPGSQLGSRMRMGGM